MAKMLSDMTCIPPITHSKLLSYGPASRFTFDTSVEPELQNGPKCGLVALAMSLRSKGIETTVDEIFELGKKLEHTKQGEMFSAKKLSDLANQISPNCSNFVEFPEPHEMSKSLLNGYHYLVAYDCDKNFSATKLNGHKAHWLLVCGFLNKNENPEEISDDTHPVKNPEDLVLLGYQGKSKYLGFFPYQDIFESNAQLYDAGPIRSTNEYKVEDFKDLRNKVVSINI